MKLIRLETSEGPAWINPELISSIAKSTLVYDNGVGVYLNVTHGIYRFDLEGTTVDNVKKYIERKCR